MIYKNESQEMYLETILKLQNSKANFRAIDIANELEYSKPSVSRAVGILKNDGFIVVEKDGAIKLTEEGVKKASGVLERHKVLTEAFVKMGLERRSAEDNACRAEHVLSDDAVEAIKSHFKIK